MQSDSSQLGISYRLPDSGCPGYNNEFQFIMIWGCNFRLVTQTKMPKNPINKMGNQLISRYLRYSQNATFIPVQFSIRFPRSARIPLYHSANCQFKSWFHSASWWDGVLILCVPAVSTPGINISTKWCLLPTAHELRSIYACGDGHMGY